MTIIDLPPEIRYQIWSAYLDTLYPPGSSPIDKICETLDSSCGNRHKNSTLQVLALLLANRQIHTDVSSLLSTVGPARRKHALAFCSPACAAAVIPKMGRLQVNMMDSLQIHTHGVWGVPMEAMREIHLRVLKILSAADGAYRSANPQNESESAESAHWGYKFEGRGMPTSSRWKMVFFRLPSDPPGRSIAAT
jgi:hypothetical protein